jgi:hypothetical protein
LRKAYLKKINLIPTFLIFINFINDPTQDGPKMAGEWIGAYRMVKLHLGINEKDTKNSPQNYF